jgi:hypothetical protein
LICFQKLKAAFPVARAPASDYGRDLGKLEGSVGVLTKLMFTVISFLVALAGGGIFLLSQIHDVKSSVDETKAKCCGCT